MHGRLVLLIISYVTGVRPQNGTVTLDHLHDYDGTSAVTPAAGLAGSGRISGEQRNEILAIHNTLRRLPEASNMEYLMWDDGLEKISQQTADGCVLQPSSTQNAAALQGPEVGQINVTSAVRSWYDDTYDVRTGRCGQLAECSGHLNLVWATTNKVGCAYRICGVVYNPTDNRTLTNSTLLVCTYDRGPLMLTEASRPYTVGPACSQCPDGADWCDTGQPRGLCRRNCNAELEACIPVISQSRDLTASTNQTMYPTSALISLDNILTTREVTRETPGNVTITETRGNTVTKNASVQNNVTKETSSIGSTAETKGAAVTEIATKNNVKTERTNSVTMASRSEYKTSSSQTSSTSLETTVKSDWLKRATREAGWPTTTMSLAETSSNMMTSFGEYKTVITDGVDTDTSYFSGRNSKQTMTSPPSQGSEPDNVITDSPSDMASVFTAPVTGEIQMPVVRTGSASSRVSEQDGQTISTNRDSSLFDGDVMTARTTSGVGWITTSELEVGSERFSTVTDAATMYQVTSDAADRMRPTSRRTSVDTALTTDTYQSQTLTTSGALTSTSQPEHGGAASQQPTSSVLLDKYTITTHTMSRINLYPAQNNVTDVYVSTATTSPTAHSETSQNNVNSWNSKGTFWTIVILIVSIDSLLVIAIAITLTIVIRRKYYDRLTEECHDDQKPDLSSADAKYFHFQLGGPVTDVTA